jgi:hypothetical protein
MAAKTKAPTVKAVKSKTKAAPKGLQLSSAQWKAYNNAYNASSTSAYQKIALGAAAQRFRKYRLQAAYATQAKANVAASVAKTAAIAAYAAKQSWNQSKVSKQNKALQARIELDAYNHGNIAGRLQFIQAGEKAYAATAVARTVDTAQATAYERVVFAKAAKAAKTAKKSVSTKSTNTVSPKVKAQIAAVAAAAGLKAAKATKSRAAPYRGVHRGKHFDGNGHWILGNNDFEGTCIMTAVANALYHQTKWRLPDEDIAYWTGRAGKHPDITGVLNMLWVLQPWPQVRLLQPIPLVASYEYFCERIIGFDDHAAFAFGAKMVSYGELLPVVEADEVVTCEFVERDT